MGGGGGGGGIVVAELVELMRIGSVNIYMNRM